MTALSALLRAHIAAFRGDTSGAAASEFALVVAFFIILVFGTINTGLAMSALNQVNYAAERSARCLATTVSTTNCTKANIDTYAKAWYKGPPLTTFAFQADATDPVCGKRVTGTGSYAIITGFESTAITITATACYPII